MTFRLATAADLDAVAQIYADIHTVEENDGVVTGWRRGIYPTRETAEAGLRRGDLFVLEADGAVLGAAVINQTEVDIYALGAWRHPVLPEQICVLHTLVISPHAKGRGLGRAFAQFYEDYARSLGCTELRIDTNERNLPARALYASLGYREVGIAPTTFNGLEGVRLVMLEKYIGA